MKKGYKKLLIICLSLAFLLTLTITFNVLEKNSYILFLFAVFLSLIFLIGIEKDKYIYKKDLILTIIISCSFYLIITYSIGLWTGFVKNGYKLTFINISKNIFSFMLIIFLEELIRYNLVKKGSRNLSVILFTILITVLMDISLIIKGFDLKNNYLFVEFFLSRLLPSIFKNSFLTYATYKGGYKTGILYRIIMESPTYFMPIFPKLGIYIESIFKIVFPSLVGFILYRITWNKVTKNEVGDSKSKKIGISLLIVFIGVTILINSGLLKYYTLTIGSGSMTPNINKGDIVIVEKLEKNELSSLDVGDILVFKKGDIILVHRIVDIIVINEEYQVYTKGDANNDIDRFITEEKDIIGTAKFRLMIFGYPTVWLSEFINNNS